MVWFTKILHKVYRDDDDVVFLFLTHAVVQLLAWEYTVHETGSNLQRFSRAEPQADLLPLVSHHHPFLSGWVHQSGVYRLLAEAESFLWRLGKTFLALDFSSAVDSQLAKSRFVCVHDLKFVDSIDRKSRHHRLLFGCPCSEDIAVQLQLVRYFALGLFLVEKELVSDSSLSVGYLVNNISNAFYSSH